VKWDWTLAKWRYGRGMDWQKISSLFMIICWLAIRLTHEGASTHASGWLLGLNVGLYTLETIVSFCLWKWTPRKQKVKILVRSSSNLFLL
jgi:hypothetical protein